MRKNNINKSHVEGYLWDSSKLKKKVSGPNSKNPGTEFITGHIDIAVDEEGLNIIPVYFTYVTAVYSKSQKKNENFNILTSILDNPKQTWLESGKENALKLSIDGNLELNDSFFNGERTSFQRVGGSFIHIVSNLNADTDKRNTFQADVLITNINQIDKNEERNIFEDFVKIRGMIFNFRNEILPVEFVVRNPKGMEYFNDLDVSLNEPVFTKIWGDIRNNVVVIRKEEESAWGEAAVTETEKVTREWVIRGTARVPYEFGEEEIMTKEDLVKAQQDREVHWADVQNRMEEQTTSPAPVVTPSAMTTDIPTKSFHF